MTSKKRGWPRGQPLFFEGGRQPAARIIRPPLAGEFHTCGLRSVFSDAHVVRKNDWNLFRVCGRESLRRFAPCAARGACFLPVRAENAAGGGWEMLRRFGCGGLFAARGSKQAARGILPVCRRRRQMRLGRACLPPGWQMRRRDSGGIFISPIGGLVPFCDRGCGR